MTAKQISRLATAAAALTIAVVSTPVFAAAAVAAAVDTEPFISLPTLVLSACALTCGVLLFALTRKLQTIPRK